MIDAFEAQEVANTLHIMVKTHYLPWDQSLVPALEVRAEALADTFNTQQVANTLWAYATMGWEPGAGLMRKREGRMEADGHPSPRTRPSSLPHPSTRPPPRLATSD